MFAVGLALFVAPRDASASPGDKPPGERADAPKEDSAAVRAAARKLAEEGIALLDGGRAADGIAKLEQAEAKFHAPTHLLYLARAYRDIGEIARAADDYERLVGETIPNYAPDEFREAQRLAADELAAIAPKLAKIAVVLHGAKRDDAMISIDGGAPKPLLESTLVSQGSHHVLVTIGARGRSADVIATNGEVHTVDMRFDDALPPKPPARTAAPSAPSQGPPLLAPAIVSFAIGGAGVIAGTSAGVASLNKVNELEKRCPTKVGCAPSDQSLADDARTLGNVSTGAFVVGGIGVAAGLVLALWPSKEHSGPKTHSVEPLLGPGYWGLKGAF